MGGHRWLAAADWAARLEGAFPGFGQAALDRRHAVVGSTINGIAVCHISEEEAPPGWTEALVPLARERLPGLQEHPRFDGLRNRLEAALHEAGRDRAIVELQADLPKGGEITERVRAHLYLGDLEGALATWEEPGAEMPDLANGLLQKGTLLCVPIEAGTSKIPQFTIVLAVGLSLSSVFVLIWFIHHAATSIQASSVIEVAGQELDTAIRQTFPARDEDDQVPCGRCDVDGLLPSLSPGALCEAIPRRGDRRARSGSRAAEGLSRPLRSIGGAGRRGG